MKAFADTMMKMLDSVESVRDPQMMAKKLNDYAQGADKVFNALKERVESGDKSAEFEMQQHMLNNELGDRAYLLCLVRFWSRLSCLCVRWAGLCV